MPSSSTVSRDASGLTRAGPIAGHGPGRGALGLRDEVRPEPLPAHAPSWVNTPAMEKSQLENVNGAIVGCDALVISECQPPISSKAPPVIPETCRAPHSDFAYRIQMFPPTGAGDTASPVVS